MISDSYRKKILRLGRLSLILSISALVFSGLIVLLQKINLGNTALIIVGIIVYILLFATIFITIAGLTIGIIGLTISIKKKLPITTHLISAIITALMIITGLYMMYLQ